MTNSLMHKRFEALLDTSKVRQLNPESPAFKPTRLASSLKRFGITVDEYHALLIKQNHVCAICGNPCSTRRWLSVDHDHETGKVRGLLCAKCNTGLGLLGDNLGALCMALDYLLQASESKEPVSGEGAL